MGVLVTCVNLHLKDQNYVPHCEMNGETGLDQALSGNYDLIVLDLMLPNVDGFEICRRVRAKDIKTPILILTAKTEEIDKVIGLELGADDYLTKPFGIREFLARVKALFRRQEAWGEKSEVSEQKVNFNYGALSIDMDKRRVAIDDRRVELSPKEFDLLVLLASTPGKSYDRSKILNLVWGYEFEGYEHTVNSHINRLRIKIEPDVSNPSYILTTWGVGYRFNEEI